MTEKFYIHWESSHVLKRDKQLQLSEYCSYNISDKEHIYVYHISDGYMSYITSLLTKSVNANFIFTTGVKVYYFDGKILQCGLDEIYSMQKVKENVFCGGHYSSIWINVDKDALYLLKIDPMNQTLNEMSHYYPITEWIFLHAKSCTKLYKWRSLYDKVITVNMNDKRNIMKIWMNADITDVLILNPVNHDI